MIDAHIHFDQYENSERMTYIKGNGPIWSDSTHYCINGFGLL